MTVPRQAPYVVVGAGIHGLSTAYHLAKELGSRGVGSGADVLVLEKSHPGAGASGIACGVVRNNYFQPAMSELMQACVEVWESDPEAYHYHGVGYIALGAAGAGGGPRRGLRAPAADRLPLRADRRRGRGRRAHEGALPRLARAGRDRLPARAPGRLRVQPRVDARARATSAPREGVADRSTGVEVTGFELARRRRRHRGRDRAGRDRGRRAGRGRAGPVGRAALGDARPAADDRHPHAVGRRRRATGRCGRTGTSRRARSRSTR